MGTGEEIVYILNGGCPTQFAEDFNLDPAMIEEIDNFVANNFSSRELVIGQAVNGLLEIVGLKSQYNIPIKENELITEEV